MFEYKFDELLNPVLRALCELGGSGTNLEIEEKLIELLNLSDEEACDVYESGVVKLSYRTGWAKNYLKQFGVIENSRRGVWALTSKGTITREVDVKEVKDFVRKKYPPKKYIKKLKSNDSIEHEDEKLSIDENLICLLKEMKPDAFERLSQRFLRELGFINVEVTGKSGDGGIDGIGSLKIGGVLSFHVVFQCKRYAGSVSCAAIRDFRGAMIGRADKGLFITTGTFTREAKKESQRDGAPQIDLIDGSSFVEHLKALRLGVKVEMREEIIIKPDWFDDI